MKHLLIICLCSLLATGSAQSGPPSDTRRAERSLSEIRTAIAWYGAACVMGATEMDTIDGPVTLTALAEETGVPLAQIATWAAARDAEHSIAVDVLLRGGEPLRDPPEPFMTILRQAQRDCQDLDRSRRVLQAALDRGDLPEHVEQRPRALRAELDPLPFDFERSQRLAQVLRHIDDALAAGDFAADLEALLQAVTQIETLTLADVDAAAEIYSVLPGEDPHSLLAYDLLLPNPEAAVDLEASEIADVLARIEVDPEGSLARYYWSLLIANPDLLPENLVTIRVEVDTEGNATPADPETVMSATPCTRLHGTAALLCERP